MLFPTLKKIRGGGVDLIFFRKTILSHFTFYVERDSWNLYTLYPLFPCSDFVSQMWGGGGVMFFSHFMLFPTFLETKKLGIQNNYFSFNVFFVFFLYAGNIVKCPFTYSYWLNGR